ncbi:hypothetical protein CTAYLR_006200 [Chrysophaeum taylorii]|uniref:Uncharacterized protein n=1 Tax=Chrysophaeum taylorii TaxID=2483200 RepID=A0AAD7UPY2_9STRA|nr:hypothetical protein CTAYLR_006200 [Chrysophaeum taylorii]
MIATLRMAAFMMMILFAGAADLVGKLTGGAGEFGYACAIHSNKVVVGAPRANNSMGEAFVYETLLSQVARVVASDGAASDEFGSSVAIDGATFVVGAPGDNEKKGAAYVFNASTYSQTTKLTAGDDGEANDYFGSAVAIYENKIVVGAYGAFASAFDAGAAYVFDRGSLVQKLVAADSSEAAYFGRAVAIHIDWIVVGAHQDSDLGPNAGSAYVFDATTFNELSKLQASDAFNLDNFGRAVAVYADTIVVGAYLEDDLGTDAGAAYVFNAKTFDQLAKLVASDGDSNDFFGYSVSVDADAIIVGAYGDAGDKGAAYVFDTSYTQTATLSAKNGGSGDVFGWSTAISQSSIVVGAYGDDDLGSDAGAVYSSLLVEFQPVASSLLVGSDVASSLLVASVTVELGSDTSSLLVASISVTLDFQTDTSSLLVASISVTLDFQTDTSSLLVAVELAQRGTDYRPVGVIHICALAGPDSVAVETSKWGADASTHLVTFVRALADSDSVAVELTQRRAL